MSSRLRESVSPVLVLTPRERCSVTVCYTCDRDLPSLPELRQYAVRYVLKILCCCLKLYIKHISTVPSNQNNLLLTSVWSEQETADIIDYLYLCRGGISDGNFPPGTFNDLAVYLNMAYPGSGRSRNSVLYKFGSVRLSFSSSYQMIHPSTSQLKDDIAIIDRYNAEHGGAPDSAIVLVTDEERFSTYLSTTTTRVNAFLYLFEWLYLTHLKDCEILEQYRHTPFPNYTKLKAVLRCIELTSLGCPSSDGNLFMNPVIETPATTHPNHPFLCHDPSTSFPLTLPPIATQSALLSSLPPLLSQTLSSSFSSRPPLPLSPSLASGLHLRSSAVGGATSSDGGISESSVDTILAHLEEAVENLAEITRQIQSTFS